MKRLSLMMIVGISLWMSPSSAQVRVNINLGAQPQWGPSGYNHVDYYYLPDIETYYSVPKRQFVYLNNGNWVFSNSLPARNSSYNLYNGYKVVMNSPQPYKYFNDHKVKYSKYKGAKGKQTTLKAVPSGQGKKLSTTSSPKVNVNHSGNQGNGNHHNGNSSDKSSGKDSDKGSGKGKGKNK